MKLIHLRDGLPKPRSPLRMCLFSALLAGAHLSQAQLVANGSFEAGTFPPWSVTGVATIETTDSVGVPAADGTRQAFLTSNSPESAAALETALFGTSSGQLLGLGNGTPSRGSVLVQTTVTVAENQSIQFSYDFLTNEDPVDPTHANDFAFVTLGNSIVTLASVNDPPKDMTLAPASTGFTSHTGYLTFNFDVAPGTYTLGFGVVDVRDGASPSGLLVDGISVVPEPLSSTMWFAAGLLVFGVGRYVRCNRRANGAR